MQTHAKTFTGNAVCAEHEMSCTVDDIRSRTIPPAVPVDAIMSIGSEVEVKIEIQIPGRSMQKVDGDAGAAVHDVTLPLHVSLAGVEIGKDDDQFLRYVGSNLDMN